MAKEFSGEKTFEELNRRLSNMKAARDKALDENTILNSRLQLEARFRS